MDAEIRFWETVILSNKKYDPRNKEQEAAFDIAEYFVSREKKENLAA